MSSGQAQHICFYSNSCKWSARFIAALKETPFFHEVQFISIDKRPDGTRAKYPSWLKKVPTLVVSGEPEPRTDENVLNWISERRLKATGGGGMGFTVSGNRGGAMQPGGGGGATTEPEPWLDNEMGGSFTKSYSMIGSGNDYEAPMGNFEFLNGGNSMAVRTGSDIPGGMASQQQNQKTKKEELFDKEMERFMKSRNVGVPQMAMRQ